MGDEPVWVSNLKLLRGKSGKTQAAIGKALNKGQRIIANWENNISQPSLEDLLVLSQYYGISADKILSDDLSNVDLIRKNEDAEKRKNVDLNVGLHVDPKPKKYEENELVTQTGEGFDVYREKYTRLLEKHLAMLEQKAVTESAWQERFAGVEASISVVREFLINLPIAIRAGSPAELDAAWNRIKHEQLSKQGSASDAHS